MKLLNPTTPAVDTLVSYRKDLLQRSKQAKLRATHKNSAATPIIPRSIAKTAKTKSAAATDISPLI